MKIVDARGLSCPQPIILFKQALETNSSDTYQVVVDTAVAKENVSRFGIHSGFAVHVEEKNGEYYLNFKK